MVPASCPQFAETDNVTQDRHSKQLKRERHQLLSL